MSVVANTREQLLSSGSWSIDRAHSTIEFRVKHMVIQTVRGRFRDFDGAIVSGDPPSVVGTIRVASLDTLNDDRDAHLRSPDFFDVERYPEILFHGDAIRFDGEDERFVLPGELTIKGVTHPITLAGELGGSVVDDDGNDRIALALSGRLDRFEYGLVWNRMLESGHLLVGDAVDLLLDISAIRAD
jgi:polyisoprenoid-binding protein YceI